MGQLRILTAGESHGSSLVAIIDGLPSGILINPKEIDGLLLRRQRVFGRGERMSIESDSVSFLSGIRSGKTLGSPIAMVIPNKDHENWKSTMAPFSKTMKPAVTIPRPGHADLVGALKFNTHDIRDVIERASARETAIRSAVGAVCMQFLKCLGVTVRCEVVSIGTVSVGSIEKKRSQDPDESDLCVGDAVVERKMKALIERAKKAGDTLGGIIQVSIHGLPVGLGSYTQSDLRLDARFGAALLSIQAVKGVQVGMGFESTRTVGSRLHDEIHYSRKNGFYRQTNHAGGIEGGISNGEPIVLQAAVKPLASVKIARKSVDIVSKQPVPSRYERSDVCVVPAAAIVGQAVLATEVSTVILEKFGGDSLPELKRNWSSYLRQVALF